MMNETAATTLNGAGNSDILFSYFAIFDGHGGKEAAQYCKEKLYWKIIECDDFWSDDDARVLNAIRQGFAKCHTDMWGELPKWPKTGSGLPSTSGSTATILFIKKSKAYVGHVGDSGLVIGYNKTTTSSTNNTNTSNSSTTARQGSQAGSQGTNQVPWHGKKLTRDYKPEDPIELKRIQNSGGCVMQKSGVNRVVWQRPVLSALRAAATASPVDSSSSSESDSESQSS